MIFFGAFGHIWGLGFVA
jgi:hypothetical protein